MRWGIGSNPKDIKDILRKKGATYRKLAAENNCHISQISDAFRKPCYAGEQAIAKGLGLPAFRIWPDRYDAEGRPLHKRIRKRFNMNSDKTPSQNCEAA